MDPEGRLEGRRGFDALAPDNGPEPRGGGKRLSIPAAAILGRERESGTPYVVELNHLFHDRAGYRRGHDLVSYEIFVTPYSEFIAVGTIAGTNYKGSVLQNFLRTESLPMRRWSFLSKRTAVSLPLAFRFGLAAIIGRH